ncbi:deoxynucleoside kinase [Lacibacter sp. MH-610]|uniref:deoxynucleoside kinase n=1 Tax=Lacibacter sp. MH-610 TaxID=3020883 RepID=UPI003892B412
MRIEICGAIGSGKSSLAKLLLEHGYEVVFEEFKLNPFWKAFYSNPDKYNFETEVTFILQHYHDLKRKLEESNSAVCDFSFTQDLGYAVMGLKRKPLKIFKSIYDYIIEELGEPSLIISMKCSAEELLRRIKLRGREEEILINSNFLLNLSSFVNAEVEKKRKLNKYIQFLEIDTEKLNIITNSKDQNFILKKIEKLI